jgi:hypothetical protein
VDEFENCPLLDELWNRVYVQEDAVSYKSGCWKIAGPHLKLIFADFSFFFLKEEFWKPAELFVIRLLQRAFNQDVKKVKHHRHMMPLRFINYIQTQTLLTSKGEIAFFTLSTGRHREIFITIKVKL